MKPHHPGNGFHEVVQLRPKRLTDQGLKVIPEILGALGMDIHVVMRRANDGANLGVLVVRDQPEEKCALLDPPIPDIGSLGTSSDAVANLHCANGGQQRERTEGHSNWHVCLI